MYRGRVLYACIYFSFIFLLLLLSTDFTYYGQELARGGTDVGS